MLITGQGIMLMNLCKVINLPQGKCICAKYFCTQINFDIPVIAYYFGDKYTVLIQAWF